MNLNRKILKHLKQIFSESSYTKWILSKFLFSTAIITDCIYHLLVIKFKITFKNYNIKITNNNNNLNSKKLKYSAQNNVKTKVLDIFYIQSNNNFKILQILLSIIYNH